MSIPDCNTQSDRNIHIVILFFVISGILLVLFGALYGSAKHNLERYNNDPLATINDTRCINAFGEIQCLYTFVYKSDNKTFYCMMKTINTPLLSPNQTYVMSVDGSNCYPTTCGDCDINAYWGLLWATCVLIPIGIVLCILNNHVCIKNQSYTQD